MIEPVFVGLLAAAFAFLFPQLLSRVHELAQQYESAWWTIEEISKEREIELDLGLLEPHLRMLESVAWFHFGIGFAVFLYVFSLMSLVWGYWSDIDAWVVSGLMLLLIALTLCGLFLNYLFLVSWKERRRRIDVVYMVHGFGDKRRSVRRLKRKFEKDANKKRRKRN